jgi:hypothetical protein
MLIIAPTLITGVVSRADVAAHATLLSLPCLYVTMATLFSTHSECSFNAAASLVYRLPPPHALLTYYALMLMLYVDFAMLFTFAHFHRQRFQ